MLPGHLKRNGFETQVRIMITKTFVVAELDEVPKRGHDTLYKLIDIAGNIQQCIVR